MNMIIEKIETIGRDSAMSALEKMDTAVALLRRDGNASFALIDSLTPAFKTIIEQGMQEGVFYATHTEAYAELMVMMLLYLKTRTEMRPEKAQAFAFALETLLETELGTFKIINETGVQEAHER